MESVHVAPNVAAGTVAAAECCYGAELFDYRAVGTAQPICMSYLLGGAYAYLGSTNIAYGPAVGNGQADLITQYFLQNLLTGATTGRAFLQARQTFIRTQVMSSPANLKMLAQFILLSDPALRPCAAPDQAGVAVSEETGAIAAKGISAALTEQEVVEPAQARKLRRVALHGLGLALGASASKPGPVVEIGASLLRQLGDSRGRRGWRTRR